MRRALTLGLIVAAVAATVGAQQMATPYRDPEGAEEAARRALRTFALLVNEGNYEELGFESPSEPRSATLGEPYGEFMVRLDRLEEYQPGGDASELLNATGRLTYPVLVGERTRSSLTVTMREGSWTSESFGAPSYSRRFTEVRDRLGRERPSSEYFEVRVPALNVSFVGELGESGLLLTPVFDDPRFGFESGGTQPADRALSAMVAAAREHNGLPT